jgi:GT2 family glycosyltransferase
VTGAPAPRASVVIPTVDRVALLERCLRGLRSPTQVPFEVVVAHDGHPAIERVIERWSEDLPLRGIRTASRTAAVKRNAGWRSAGGEVIAFLDDDCEPAPGWLDAALASIDAGADLVQGRVLPHPDDSEVTGTFARSLVVDGASDYYPNANLVYRRGLLESVGGFDESFWGGGEDTDLAWRSIAAGAAVTYAPDALVWPAVRPATFRQHLRSLPRWATLALVVRRHPHLRRLLHHRVFWKDTHPAALLATVGLAGAVLDRRALVLVAPLLRRRLRDHGPRDAVQLAAADMVEVLVVLYGSARYRSVLL